MSTIHIILVNKIFGNLQTKISFPSYRCSIEYVNIQYQKNLKQKKLLLF